MGFWSNCLGTLESAFGIGKSKLSAIGLTAARTHTLPDVSGTLATEGAVLLQNGFVSWGGSGDYYSVSFPNLTLLRPATGRIAGKEVVCIAGQTVALTNYNTSYIGVNASGVLVATTTVDSAWYASNFALF